MSASYTWEHYLLAAFWGPAHLYDEDKIFHLRGAIDYSTMGLKHKLMMKFMHGKLARMPEKELNAESKIILETYGKKVDYVDFNTLHPIVSIITPKE